jgi:diguanylate cyclase (GGDEF)-like protein
MQLSQPARTHTYAVLLAAAILIIYWLQITLIRDEAQRIFATNLTYTSVSVLCTVPFYFAARMAFQQSQKRVFYAWAVIFTAQFFFALGDISWFLLEAILHQEPFPSIADGFFLVYYPLFLTGILLLPKKVSSQEERIKKGLDMGMIVIASTILFGNFLIGPIAANGKDDPLLATVLSIMYPAGDLLLLWGLVALIYHQTNRKDGLPLLLLAVSMFTTIVTDCIFSIQSLSDSYVSGSLLDMGWIISYLFAAFAGYHQIGNLRSNIDRAQILMPTQVESMLRKSLAYLPYLWLAGAYTLLIHSRNAPDVQYVPAALGVTAIIVLVIIRQVIAIQENRRLNQSLQQQTLDLETVNHALKHEIIFRQRAEEQRLHDALHDSLTGLPNRALVIDRLEQSMALLRRRTGEQVSVLFLDIDHFKVVNDSLGHTAGDQMLVEIAARLKHCLRSSDTVARFGGDEFVILLQYTKGEDHTVAVAKRILEILRSPFALPGQQVYTSASMGIISSIARYTRAGDILQDADIAMNQAKMLGKGRFEIFSPELRMKAVARHLVETQLREATVDQQFVLHYQPIYSLSNRQRTGFEALLRWNHPKRGLVMPGEFLTVAEESGLILPIGHWVLREACAQMSQWHKQFPHHRRLTINVNISGRQLSQPDFVEQVMAVLDETGLAPEYLKLEITESVVIENQEMVNEFFSRLRGMGVQLQIDDFGTGYSSLSYLQHFPIQSIKIDRSFIQDICTSNKNADLVRTIVQMARNLGMEPIAEGIETQDQLEALTALQCKYGQGFFFSKPVDRESAAEALGKEPAPMRALLPE